MKKIIERLGRVSDFAIETLKGHGADKACTHASETEKTEFNVDGGEFSLLRTVFTDTVAMSVIKNHKYGTVSVNKTDEASVISAAENCISAAESSETDECRDIAPSLGKKEFIHGAVICDKEKLFFRAKELLSDITKRYPKIVIEQMIVSHSRNISVYGNTSGSVFTSKSGKYRVDLMYSAHDGETSTSFFSDGFITDCLDTRFINMCEIEKNLSDVEKQLSSITPKEKFVGVMLLPPSCLGSFIYDLYSNFLSDKAILSGSSLWLNKVGQRVVDDRISIGCFPSDGRMVDPTDYTFDGYVCKDTDIIENGVLRNFVISDYVARKTGHKRTPTDFSSVVVKGGSTPLSEIISRIDHGIIVGRFSGGETSSNGDFAGVAKNSFLIEKGKIVSALAETMISGNLQDIFSDVFAISAETVCDGTSSLPYIAVNGVTVSSK